jgi:excisionase family DNA binding protein
MAQLLTRQDAADELGVSLSTLTRLVRVRALPIVKVGRRTLVRPSAIERYIVKHEGYKGGRRRAVRLGDLGQAHRQS